MKVGKKYRKALTEYLRWLDGAVLFRPEELPLDPDGLSAAEAMMQWESHGKPLPTAVSEPKLLADYIQGKRQRDWHISEWSEGIKDGLFHWREFIGTFGLTEEEVRKILPTTPWPREWFDVRNDK